MSTSFIRSGSANTFDAAVRNITSRQTALASLQENLTSGKRVVRASDDPTNAANAERALTRISRITTNLRALEAQRSAITQAEGALGEISDAMQRFRELVVSAGNGVFSSAERRSIAIELQGLRDQIFSAANSKGNSGQPLFGGLGSALSPFVGPKATSPEYTFNGLPGQSSSTDVAIPFTLDGDKAFMLQTARDQVFNVAVSNSVDGLISADRTLTTSNVVASDISLVTTTATAAAAVAPPGNVPYPTYSIVFGAVTPDPTNPLTGPSTVSYTVTEVPAVSATLLGPLTSAPLTFTPGKSTSINVTEIPGLSISINGTPKENDTITINSSPSAFSVLDNAIRSIRDAANNNGVTQAVSQSLHNIDISMERISAVRAVGDLLNRADRISANQGIRSIQLEADRSRAEDLDMIQGISDFQNKSSGFSAALQTYAQVQKLSLFNFIS